MDFAIRSTQFQARVCPVGRQRDLPLLTARRSAPIGKSNTHCGMRAAAPPTKPLPAKKP
jgi:hypothetical protein